MKIVQSARGLRLGIGITGVILLFAAMVTVNLAHAKDIEDRIIFVSTDGRRHVLSLTDGLQGEPVQLNQDLPQALYPSLSRDGKEVVFLAFPNIAKMDIATRQIEWLTDVVDPRQTKYSKLAWSPDGAKIAFLKLGARGPEGNICVMDIEDRSIRQLTDSAVYRSRPSWSPDSRKIVYAERDPESRDFDLFVIGVADHTITNITETSDVRERFPVWLPDNRIAFLRGGKPREPYRAYMINMDSSELQALQLLIEPSSPGNGINGWCWSPDGVQILLTRRITIDGSPPMVQHRIYLVDVASGAKTLWVENGYDPDWVKPGYVSSMDAKKDR